MEHIAYRKVRIWVTITIAVIIFLIFAIYGLSPIIMRPAEPFAPLDEFLSHLDERIPVLMRYYRIPGASIALVKDKELVWSGAYGYADIANERMMTTDTPMRVQSISKSVTAWGIMKLAEQGEIELNSPVTEYLKSWRFPSSGYSSERVTVRQLLSHTAGLPLGDVFTIYSPEETKPSLKEKLTEEAVLIREPGKTFSYSNTGYNLLELLIEEVSGRDFNQYMEQEILTPLGMNHSTFESNKAFIFDVPVGYDLKGRPVPVYVYPEKASGGLFATVKDIAAFTIAGMPDVSSSQQVLSSAGIKELFTPVRRDIGIYSLVFDAYGLGYYVETMPNGIQAVSHGGQGTGIMTHFHAIPETGDAIVILTNSQRSWPFISYLLSDWAKWRGFSHVGMGKIIWGKYGLWAVIGLIWSMVFLQLLRLSVRMKRRDSEKVMQLKYFRLVCFVQAGSAIVIIGGLVWCLFQKYLFLSSVFPRASLGLGVSALALSITLLLSAWVSMRLKCKRGKILSQHSNK